jgi:hypothetical protein
MRQEKSTYWTTSFFAWALAFQQVRQESFCNILQYGASLFVQFDHFEII